MTKLPHEMSRIELKQMATERKIIGRSKLNTIDDLLRELYPKYYAYKHLPSHRRNTPTIEKHRTSKTDCVSDYEQKAAMEAPKFKDWQKSIKHIDVKVKSTKLRDVYLFGPHGKGPAGFVVSVTKAIDQSNPVDKNGKDLIQDYYHVIRGKSVGILIRINKRKILLVEQLRVPVGKRILETAAGMMDNEKNLAGVAAKEIEEETSIKLNQKELIPLGSIYTTPGLIDEEIHLFAVDVDISMSEMKKKMKKRQGERGTNESIQLKLINFDDSQAVFATKDCKLISSYCMFKEYLSRHKI